MMAGTLRRITRKARRQMVKGDRVEYTTKRLVTHHRPLTSIVQSRERYVKDLYNDEFAKWHG